jgi:tRNA (cmo5U34)-methyltransferase
MTKFTFSTYKNKFDNHIETSIRGYNDLWRDVLSMSKYFVEDNSNVIDLGCSTGKLLKSMIEQNKEHIPNANYIGIEIEKDFFVNYENDEKQYNTLKYYKGDVRTFNFQNCSLITSIFTLQFMPLKDRENTINSIYKGLNHGGAFIFSEKTFSYDPQIQDMLTFMYYDYKRKNFTEKEILDKEVQLRHMMKPNTKTEIFDMCHRAGFVTYVFWQNFNFVGIIALKK